MPTIAAINQDRGIAPGRSKGAAVHLAAMREAFSQLGATVKAFDIHDDRQLMEQLEMHAGQPAFDMVYERYAIGKSCGAHYATRHDIPLVLEVNAPLADEQRMFREETETAQDRENDRFLFSRADCIVAVSSQVADYALARGARPESVMICPNGIDTDRFNLEVDASDFRRNLPLKSSFVIGFHGRLRPWHGFEHLVSVFTRLLDKGLPVHLLVVGEGAFEELHGLPSSSFTRFGWQPHENMPSLVAAFDALPLTYAPGTPCYFSPLKLMEAMACGVVPLVPDLGDLATVVSHGETGLVYPAGDYGTLETMLCDLVENPHARKAMGLKAAHEARAHSWKEIAHRVLERVFETRKPVTRDGEAA